MIIFLLLLVGISVADTNPIVKWHHFPLSVPYRSVLMTKACINLTDDSNQAFIPFFDLKTLPFDIEVRLWKENHLIQTIPKGTPISNMNAITNPLPDASTNVLLPPTVVDIFRKSRFKFVHFPILMSDVFFIMIGKQPSKHLCIRVQSELPKDFRDGNRLQLTFNNNKETPLQVLSPKFKIIEKNQPKYDLKHFGVLIKDIDEFTGRKNYLLNVKIAQPPKLYPTYKGKVYNKDSSLLFYFVVDHMGDGIYSIEHYENELSEFKDLDRFSNLVSINYGFSTYLDFGQKLTLKLYAYDKHGDPISFNPIVKTIKIKK